LIGGWQTSFQMFAKTGTAFTPYLTCDTCGFGARYVGPGNIAVESVDALGDFDDFIGFRPLIVGDYKHKVGDQLYDPGAFAPPPMGADVFDNPAVARKNILWTPGGWGVNFGVHKNFKFGERVNAALGADFDNVFNHPIRIPDLDFTDNTLAYLGTFDVNVDHSTLQPVLQDYFPLEDFGKVNQTFRQEGVEGRRAIRLRLRITF